MAFVILKCGDDKCTRLLYVLTEPGDQKVYCSLCGGVTLFKLRTPGQDDNEEDD